MLEFTSFLYIALLVSILISSTATYLTCFQSSELSSVVRLSCLPTSMTASVCFSSKVRIMFGYLHGTSIILSCQHHIQFTDDHFGSRCPSQIFLAASHAQHCSGKGNTTPPTLIFLPNAGYRTMETRSPRTISSLMQTIY
ncbi:hypothetical protein BJ878DRAFT_36332 [Calycina marina]|uniref:Uncharacterized protein n=1 Tax=Calycina marina TaxID=1763456 RepID=A0A9P7ZBG8_9HELO|nr:hypothetical protein BJ878DRAFT_36332 [Calycina marina]